MLIIFNCRDVVKIWGSVSQLPGIAMERRTVPRGLMKSIVLVLSQTWWNAQAAHKTTQCACLWAGYVTDILSVSISMIHFVAQMLDI